MGSSAKPRLVFLCTGNSCRSQMAEGWARRLLGERFEVGSAGTSPQGVNPMAVRVMAEVGVDLSGHSSKAIETCDPGAIDVVITVCDHAREHCPVLPGAVRTLHQSFDDPPKVAAGAATEDEALGHYRRVRDEIRAFIEHLPERLAMDRRAAEGIRT